MFAIKENEDSAENVIMGDEMEIQSHYLWSQLMLKVLVTMTRNMCVQ